MTDTRPYKPHEEITFHKDGKKPATVKEQTPKQRLMWAKLIEAWKKKRDKR